MPEIDTASTRASSFANYRSRQGEDGAVHRNPRRLGEMIAELNCLSGGWPRYCGGALFVKRGDTDMWNLLEPHDLFAWLHQLLPGGVRWMNGPGYVTKQEFFSGVRSAAKRYVSVELSPHYPQMPDVCYLCNPVNPEETGKFDELLGFFSPATAEDAVLIRAMFLTAFWGSTSCSKPLFMLSSDEGPGTGKSTLARALARLAGADAGEHYGGIEISREEGINQIKQRLLSPEAVTKRVVIIDNIRDNRINWADLEALVTAPVISGKKMYVGESQRHNTFMWVLTLNGPGASSDLSQRAVLVKLTKSAFLAGRVEELNAFIDTHRTSILGDIGFCLSQPPFEQPLHATRWATWEREILGRVGSTSAALTKITTRQDSIDAEMEEGELITERIETEMERWGVLGQPVEIWRSTVIRLCQEATGTRMASQGWGLRIKALRDRGFLPKLGYGTRTKTHRLYTWGEKPGRPCLAFPGDTVDNLGNLGC